MPLIRHSDPLLRRSWSWSSLSLFSAATAVLCLPPAFADPVDLAPIEIVAEEDAEDDAAARNPSRFVEVIDAGAASLRVVSVADLVEDAAGVRVRRYGGLGSFAAISIRGSAPSQVPILVDSVPVTDVHSGLVNLEDLPVSDLDRIEVYRGFAPLDAGDAGIGGAVNLVTRAAPYAGPAVLSSGLSTGSFGTWRAFASGASTLGACETEDMEPDPGARPGRCPGLRLTFGHLRSAGDYPFLSDNGTPLEPRDDREIRRLNNDFAQTHASLRLGVPGRRLDLDASASLTAVDRGFPGLDYAQAERARLSGTTSRLRVVAAVPGPAGGASDVTAGAFGSVRTDRFEDPAGEIGVGSQIEDDLTAAAGLHAAATTRLGGGAHVATARIEVRNDAFLPRHELPAPRDGPKQVRWLGRLGAAWESSLLDDALVLAADARLDVYQNRFAGDPWFGATAPPDGDGAGALFSPAAGVRWAVAERFDVKANAGWFHRLPAFAELFGDRGTVVGNPTLAPESAANVDAGFSASPLFDREGLRLRLDAAFFASFARDLIVFVAQSQSVFRAENVGAARTLGVEATLRLSWSDVVELRAAYTWQDARDAGDTPHQRGNRLPGRPEHDLGVRVAGTLGPVETWYEFDFAAEHHIDRANLRSVPARLLHGAGATLRWSRPRYEVAATIEAANLADSRVYDAFRYPLPGRSIFGTLKVNW